MNKKIIALLIGVFYLMSSFTFVAGAQDVTFDNDTDLTKELAVINSVNPDYILPETEAKGEEEILGFTRGQFVKLLVDVMCVLNATEADTGYDDVDDTADYAPAVKFAKDFGIISPAENFYPDSYEKIVFPIMSGSLSACILRQQKQQQPGAGCSFSNHGEGIE